MANDKDYAVIIGVKDYEGLTILNGPETDATSFRDWVIDTDGGDVPAANCTLIISEPDPVTPLQHDVDFAFRDIFKKLRATNTAGRRLYFYFSGHGLGITWDETALALPPWSTDLRNFALSSTGYLGRIIESGFFEQVFFFLDCCRNRIPGTGGAGPYFGNVKPAAATASCESLVCYATEFDTPAYEAEVASKSPSASSLDNNLVRGFFTVALINGLKGAAANKEGTVTVNSLKDFLRDNLPLLAKKEKKKQVPRFINAFSTDVTVCGKNFAAPVNVTVTFREIKNKTVILEDPNLDIIKQETDSSGSWSNIPLRKGRYEIRYADEPDGKTIRVDGTKNPFNYEF